MAEDGWLDRSYSLAGKKIWIAGERGMVGSAVMRRLELDNRLSPPPVILHSQSQRSIGNSFSETVFDLRDQAATRKWIYEIKPDVIVLAAAKVGGIKANNDAPAEFLYDNIMIEANIIHAAYESGVEKLLFLGSSCIYPREAANPITEDALLTGPLEPTNEAYAIAKIAGLKMCQAYRRQHGCDYISAMPCNLYGPGDKFDAQNSHVIPALMMKAHMARKSASTRMDVWGSGKPLREFLYVDDLADALVFLLENYSGEKPVNVGSNEEINVADLVAMIAGITGFKGDLVFDNSKPDGTMRKLMDNSQINNAGWKSSVSLKEGLARTYDWYLENQRRPRAA